MSGEMNQPLYLFVCSFVWWVTRWTNPCTFLCAALSDEWQDEPTLVPFCVQLCLMSGEMNQPLYLFVCSFVWWVARWTNPCTFLCAALSDEWRDHPDEQQDEPDLWASWPRAGLSCHSFSLWYDLHGAPPDGLAAAPDLLHAVHPAPGRPAPRVCWHSELGGGGYSSYLSICLWPVTKGLWVHVQY